MSRLDRSSPSRSSSFDRTLAWLPWLAALLLASLLLHGSAADQAVLRSVNAWAAWGSPWWTGLAYAGLGGTLLALTPVLSVHRPRRWAALLSALLVCAVVVPLLKSLMDLPRPAARMGMDELIVLGELLRGRAWPSGHTVAVVAMATVLLTEPGRISRDRWLWAWPVAWAAMAVSVSRVVVGAHWPTDVLGGASLGAAVGLMAWRAPWLVRWSRALARPSARGWTCGIGLLAAWLSTAAAVWLSEPGLLIPALAALLSAWRCDPRNEPLFRADRS